MKSRVVRENGKKCSGIELLLYGDDFFLRSEYIFILILGILAIISGLVLIFFKEKNIRSVPLKILGLFIVAVLGFVLTEIATGNLSLISLRGVVVNIAALFGLVLIIYTVSGSFKFSYCFVFVLMALLGVTEHYVMIFRGTPFVPWDLRVVKTASTVASNYVFELDNDIITMMLALIIALNVLGFIVYQKSNIKVRMICFLGAIIAIVGCLIIDKDNTNKTNTFSIAEVYKSDGIFTSFINYTAFMQYKKPKGYTKEKAEQIINDAGTVNAFSQTKAKNIIVIMNESFADLRDVDKNGIISNDYMPFIDSLSENTVKGKLVVPVFGAGTSSTEFEALTGVSCRDVPMTPYVTTINNEIDSIVNALNKEDFVTDAFHPYLISNWNRNNAYKYLQFDNIYDENALENQKLIRCWVSDISDYKKVIELEDDTDSNYFNFNVTLQNHGGYDTEFDNYVSGVDLSEYGEWLQAENFLGLVKESDKAFEQLVEYYTNCEEPTLICFFGDHYPSLDEGFYEFLNDGEYPKRTDDYQKYAEEKIHQYETPLVIWTNYDIDESDIGQVSANYLEDFILLYAGYDITGYEAYTYKLYQDYPVISPIGIEDKEGKFYESIDDINDERLLNYTYLEYSRIQGD